MKIVYCMRSISNPGGMERVLNNKITYLVNKLGWEIVLVTTDQRGLPSFYPYPKQVRMVDLDVNYDTDNTKNIAGKVIGYLKRRRLHKRRLAELLQREKADIMVSLYPSESSFMCNLHDGSKKVLELHYCKLFRLQYNRRGVMRIIDRLRTLQDQYLVRRFDKFVILTEEDRTYWGEMPNIEVIPNAARPILQHESDCTAQRVIAVGRLDYQKGFDRLIDAWAIVAQYNKFQSWRLDIFGQGEWHDYLQTKINSYGLQNRVRLNPPTTEIDKEYANSSMLVMTSHYEGLPMVMIEAMTCGIPVVSFDFRCGPNDIIDNGRNGLLVKEGCITDLAEAMMLLMRDAGLRKTLSVNARKVAAVYSEKTVMQKWINLFQSLIKR